MKINEQLISVPFKYIKSQYSTNKCDVTIYGKGAKIKEKRKLFNIIPYWKTICTKYYD